MLLCDSNAVCCGYLILIFCRSIITLGDSLLAKGQLYAAQFCYIVSEAEWGR